MKTRFIASLRKNTFSVSFFLALLFIWFSYLFYFAVATPFWDAWDFNSPILNQDSLLAIFTFQHGPARQGLGGIIQYLALALSNYNFKIIPWLALSIIYLGSFFYILVLKKLNKIDLHSSWPLLGILSASFLGHEAITLNPNISHGSLPFLLVAIIIYLQSSSPLKNWRNGLIPLFIFLATFTGFSFIFTFPFLLISALYFYFKKAHKFYYLILFLTFIISCLFFVNYNFNNSAVSCSTVFDSKLLVQYLWFTVKILTLPLFGGPLYNINHVVFYFFAVVYFLLLLYVSIKLLLLFKKFPKISSVLFSMITYSFTYGFISAVGRICLGSGSEFASRYYLYMIPALFAIIMYFQRFGPKVNFKFTILLSKTLAFILLVANLLFINSSFKEASHYKTLKVNWLDCVTNSSDLSVCGKRFPIYPVPENIESRVKIFLEKRKI
ncbi:hypothetical protein [Candidatus Methylopumilus universalis]|uniref:hypothetical protein n=1 Tax=Candidatus Methylopumilus universalis TaxID=2588536 RepID=UPI003BEF1F26